MEFLFVWLVFSLLVGWYARSKGRSFGLYFLISLLLSPVLGFLIAALHPAGGKKCPFCAERVKQEAVVCRHCGREIS